MGTERGQPIPVKDAYGRARGYKEDRDGNKVITKLDRAQLETLARQTDGKYLSGQDTRPAIEALLEEFSRMERSEYESSLFTDYEDQFYWFAALRSSSCSWTALSWKKDPMVRSLVALMLLLRCS